MVFDFTLLIRIINIFYHLSGYSYTMDIVLRSAV